MGGARWQKFNWVESPGKSFSMLNLPHNVLSLPRQKQSLLLLLLNYNDNN